MGEVPVPEVSSMGEQQENAATSAAVAPSVHDDSDDDMGDHFGGDMMGGNDMRYLFTKHELKKVP